MQEIKISNNMKWKFIGIFASEVLFDVEKISHKYKAAFFRISKKLSDERSSDN